MPGSNRMLTSLPDAAAIASGTIGPAMAQERIRISCDWGEVTADLVENGATQSLIGMLPLAMAMGDHLRQEKTGRFPSSLPDAKRQRDFTAGMLGLWGDSDFVIYYRDGRVPLPGIVVLGHIHDDASIFDRPGRVTVSIERIG